MQQTKAFYKEVLHNTCRILHYITDGHINAKPEASVEYAAQINTTKLKGTEINEVQKDVYTKI